MGDTPSKEILVPLTNGYGLKHFEVQYNSGAAYSPVYSLDIDYVVPQ
jgi:hypothetical protein